MVRQQRKGTTSQRHISHSGVFHVLNNPIVLVVAIVALAAIVSILFSSHPIFPETYLSHTSRNLDGFASTNSGVQLDGSSFSYDIVVVGAGTGGVAAAIQASRMGASVALLEETDTVGGQILPVPTMDEGYVFSNYPNGIYGEFVQSAVAHYLALGKSVGARFEPHVAQQLLREMLADANVTLYENERVASVLKEGNTVVGVVTENGSTFMSAVLIDATEYGDIIPLTGARYRVGNSLSTSIDYSSCIQDITYATVIRNYSAGVPAELQLTTEPPGYAAAAAEFNRTVAIDGTGAIVWPIPYPLDWGAHNWYRCIPDSSSPGNYTCTDYDLITRTSVNFANDYPSYAGYNPPPDFVQPKLNISFIENASERERMICEAKLKTIQFLYYAQHNLGEPSWSVANDEGFNTVYNEEHLCPTSIIPSEFKPVERLMTPIPYVRESRRIVALHTLTGKEVKRELTTGTIPVPVTTFFDSIAIGDYAIDLHNCNNDSDLEADLNETTADSENTTWGPFEIPFASFIPETINGFLPAEKNLGYSRYANGATRLQPSTMATGQAAGAIAALAVQEGIAPRNVDPFDVQLALVEARSAISPYFYDDVALIDEYWPDIQVVSTRGIMLGATSSHFNATQSLSRAEAAFIIINTTRLSIDPPATPTFADVPTDHWAYPYIEAMYSHNLTAGCAANPRQYCPDATVNREQMALFLSIALNLSMTNITQRFADVNSLHPFYTYIQSISENGIMDGCGGGDFCPAAAVPRQEMARIAVRTMNRSLNRSCLPSAESCNDLDDDCDGLIDDGVKITYYRDLDADNYGNETTTMQACTLPTGYSTTNTDCNDTNASIKPGATESCNGKDDNCDGIVDNGVSCSGGRSCVAAVCVCTPGLAWDGSSCINITAVCGNSIVEYGEVCDSGANNGTCPKMCSATCTTNNCGSSGGSGGGSSGGGSGGGGSGGGIGGSVGGSSGGAPSVATQTWFNLKTGDTVRFNAKQGNTSITNITFTMLKPRAKLTFSITPDTKTTTPSLPAGVVLLQKENIDSDNADDIGTAFTITFRIITATLRVKGISADNVRLYRLERGHWVAYNPESISADGQYTYFITRLPGLSIFAIGAIQEINSENATTQNDISNNSTTQPGTIIQGSTSNNTRDETPTLRWTSQNNHWSLISAVIAIVALIAVIVLLIRRHNSGDIIKRQLREFIQKELSDKHTPIEIQQSLESHGWPRVLVKEAFDEIEVDYADVAMKKRPVQSTTVHPHDPLHDYIQAMLDRSYTIEQIEERLIKTGWKQEMLKTVIKEYL